MLAMPSISKTGLIRWVLLGATFGIFLINLTNQKSVNRLPVQAYKSKVLEVCESTQRSFYAGLGFRYPATQKAAEIDCADQR
jgi:hypothetical protein